MRGSAGELGSGSPYNRMAVFSMKLRPVIVALLTAFSLAGAVCAQAPAAKAAKAPEKSPADLAGDAFGKLYSDKEAKLSQERFTQVIAAGLDFLIKYPTHWRANNVIKDLAFSVILSGTRSSRRIVRRM